MLNYILLQCFEDNLVRFVPNPWFGTDQDNFKKCGKWCILQILLWVT